MKILTVLPISFQKDLADWVQRQPLDKAQDSDRYEMWFQKHNSDKVMRSPRGVITRELPLVNAIQTIATTYLPSWNSLLVCSGGTSIDWHVDPAFFANTAVMINLGEVTFSSGDSLNNHIFSGTVLEFDISKPHKSVQLTQERHSLIFRTIRRDYFE